MMIDNPELMQMIVQKHALKLEIYGMKRRGRSAYVLIKEMYGLNGSCQYTDEVGNHCAVGRYLKPEFQTIEFFANDGVSVGSLTQDVDHYLRSNVLGLTEKFWSNLQDIHDDNNNWGEYDEGLTGVGKVRCNKMKKKIEAGGYD